MDSRDWLQTTYTGLYRPVYMKDTTVYMDDNVLGVSKHFNFRGFRIRSKLDRETPVRGMTSSRHPLHAH